MKVTNSCNVCLTGLSVYYDVIVNLTYTLMLAIYIIVLCNMVKQRETCNFPIPAVGV